MRARLCAQPRVVDADERARRIHVGGQRIGACNGDRTGHRHRNGAAARHKICDQRRQRDSGGAEQRR
jgi:hypothetical protein